MSRKSRRKFKKEMMNRYYKKNRKKLLKKIEEIKKNYEKEIKEKCPDCGEELINIFWAGIKTIKYFCEKCQKGWLKFRDYGYIKEEDCLYRDP